MYNKYIIYNIFYKYNIYFFKRFTIFIMKFLKKLEKPIVILSTLLIMSFGTILLFFGDLISNINKSLKGNNANYLFINWMLVFYIINIIILVFLLLFKNYDFKKVGEMGSPGYRGIKGEKGEGCVTCIDNSINTHFNKELIDNEWKTIKIENEKKNNIIYI